MANYYLNDDGTVTNAKKKKKAQNNYVLQDDGTVKKAVTQSVEKNDDIAPVTTTTKLPSLLGVTPLDVIAPTKSNKWTDGWFKKSEGTTKQAVTGTGADTALEATTGVVGMGEKILDAFAWLAPSMYMDQQIKAKGGLMPDDLKTMDKVREESAAFIQRDLYNEKEVAKNILAGVVSGNLNSPTGTYDIEHHERVQQAKEETKRYLEEDVPRYSVLDEKSHGLIQSASQMAVTQLLNPVVPWFVTTGATSFGGEVETALNEGATFEEAGGSALITAGAEILTEKLSGGISFGGKTLDEGVIKLLSKNISNKGLRRLMKVGVDVTGEGGEEIVSQFFSRLGTSLYKEEDLDEILFSEEALDEYITSFISGGVLGGASSTVNVGKSAVTGQDVLTGYSKNEQAVFDNVYQDRIKEWESKNEKKISQKEKTKIYDETVRDFEDGNIDIDTIENVLGGETLNKYNSIVKQENDLTQKLKELENAPNTVGNSKQYDSIDAQLKELQSKNEKAQLKEQLSKEVQNMTLMDSRIQESYVQREKGKQDFNVNLNQYDHKYRDTYQRAMDSGILNDQKRTHDFVDLVAKLSAEKGVSFDFMDNKKLRESGFVIDGKRINGFKNGNNITINMESQNVLESVVGHEITHVLQGSPELYSALADSVKEVAETKGVYQSMYDTAFENYKSIYKNLSEEEYAKAIEEEVTADLVAEYIFSDVDFVRNLSTKNRNVFQKIYDEIKYMYKSARAGSIVEKKILKAKKIFEDVYRESSENAENTEAEGVRYSLSSMGNTFFGDPNVSSNDFIKVDDNGVLEYKKSEGYKKYVDQCLNNMKQTKPDFDETVSRQEIENQIDGIVRVAIAAKKAGYDIFDYVENGGKQIDVKDLKDSKNRLLFSSLEPNSDYFTSSDISTICDKRQNFAQIYDDIVRAEEQKGVPHGKRFFDKVDNYFYIHEVLARKGLTQPCRQCYVESMRKNLAPMSKAFVELISETDVNNTSNKQLYTYSKKDGYKEKSNNMKLREKVLEQLDEYGMSASDLSIEILSTADGLAQLKIQAPLIYEAFNSFYGQSKPKMPKEATPFRFGELTALLTDENGKIKKALVDRINSTGGFRLQSYSDFQIQNYTDVLQTIFEAGTLGLNGHAYTKVPAFLEATEGTNLKRNISIFMYKDGNSWRIDRNDSFPYTLEEIYDIVNADKSGNTSIIAVSQNEDMSAWIMANDNVGYGIPFHKSGMKMGTVRDTDVKTDDGRTIKGYKNIKDHTRQQTEVWARTEDGHKKETKVKQSIDIYSFWDFENKAKLSKNELIEKNLKAYIDRCESRGYLPTFREYVMNNDRVLNNVLKYSKEMGYVPQSATVDDISFEYKGYKIPYGYYKFLGDFGMFTPNGEASAQKPLSLNEYNFAKAENFFANAEGLKRTELLQQFANGEERARYRDSDYTNEELENIIKQKRNEVVDEIVSSVKYSVSQDTEGNQLSQEQSEYFKDSKVRDENGFLKVMYHGTENGGFHKFSKYFSSDETSLFFTDNNETAKSYSGTHENYSAQTLRTADDFNEFFESVNADGYEVREENGQFVLYEDGDEVATSDTADGIYEEFRDWTGLGYGSANYKVYLDIKNPLVIDAEGNNWDELGGISNGSDALSTTREYSQYAKENGYDGVIFNNIIDNGLYASGAERFNPSMVAIAFDSSQIKSVDNQKPTSNPDIRYSLSDQNQSNTLSWRGTRSEDVLLDRGDAVTEESVAPVQDVVQQDSFVPDYAPLTEDEANVRDDRQIEDHYFPDTMPTEAEENYNGMYAEHVKPVDPFKEKDIFEVGKDRKQKAYMYENPEVKPFFQQEARYMLGELDNSSKGERFYNDQLYYDTNGEYGIFGTKRHTSEEIAYLLDTFNYTYKDIAKGLNAIIEDNGKENNAISKRIEFLLDERLRLGYKDFWFGDQIPPNQEYINLLNEKQINEYNDEAFGNWLQNLSEDDIKYLSRQAESFESAPQEYAPMRDDFVETNKMVEEIPLYDAKAGKGVVEGQQSMFDETANEPQDLRQWASDLMGDTSTWVDKKLGIQYATNTLRRNLRDIVRDETGKPDIAKADRIYDAIAGEYNRNHALLNKESNQIKQQFADMKINQRESEYIQMLGELKYNPDTTLTKDVVDEYLKKYKSKIDTKKVDVAIEQARKVYDDLFERTNQALREHGFKEMEYRKGYFPHFTKDKQGVLGKIFNWKTKNHEIPTSIAGITDMFRPQRSWQAFDKHRHGDATDYDFLQGMDNYVDGALDWIYHIGDIQKRRAFETEIRYRHSDKGVQTTIDEIMSNENMSQEQKQILIEAALREADNPLGNFLTDFMNATNTLANKKSAADRGMEQLTNRQVYSTMTNISNRVTANMVVGSVSSAMTNFIPITQSWSQVSPVSTLSAIKDTLKATVHDDGVIEKSVFLTNRLRQADKLSKTGWDKAIDKAAFMMTAIDNFTSQVVWRSKYAENISKGMSESEAIKNADLFAEGLIAGRSKGNMPTIFDSKNPIVKTFTAFQLEVSNQYGYMFKDMPTDMKNEGIGKLTQGYAAMFVGAYVYNALYATLTGRNAAFDPVRIIQEFLGDLYDEEEEELAPMQAFGDLAENVLEQTPYIGGLLGGGRIPISSVLPYDGLKEMVTGTVQDVADKDWKNLANEWSNPLYYLALPAGGGQLRKTVQGLSMFDDDLPTSGSYTSSGNMRFPVEDTFLNRLQAGIFGQYANKNAREYFDRGESSLKEKQIQEYMDLDLPIADYWDYRSGLKKQETLEDKFEYVNDMDVSTEKKNIMINNVVDREVKVDMSKYDEFANYEEFDWYTKNTEKYNYFKEYGISYSEYKNADDDTKEAINSDYNVYKNYPDIVTLSKAVNDNWIEYRSWYKEIGAIKADKDANGKTINGSGKRKKMEYIENLNLDAGQKMIMHMMFFDGTADKNKYNPQIVEYLDSRDDITYEEMVTILERLNMKVHPDGRVTW